MEPCKRDFCQIKWFCVWVHCCMLLTILSLLFCTVTHQTDGWQWFCPRFCGVPHTWPLSGQSSSSGTTYWGAPLPSVLITPHSSANPWRIPICGSLIGISHFSHSNSMWSTGQEHRWLWQITSPTRGELVNSLAWVGGRVQWGHGQALAMDGRKQVNWQVMHVDSHLCLVASSLLICIFLCFQWLS